MNSNCREESPGFSRGENVNDTINPTTVGPVIVLDDTATIHQGDAREVLAAMPDNSIDSVVTDPPYGLSAQPDMAEVLRHWLAGDDYQHNGNGFMGAGWDSFVPGPAVWREALRVLKPGGHALVFSSERTYDLTVTAMRLAGFEIRGMLNWVFASGMPKSLDVAKSFAKAGDPARAAEWQGWGTALKPGHEPIVIARKPLDGTVIETVAAHGTGSLNIGASRVRTNTPQTREGEASAERRYTSKGATNFAATPGPRGGSPEGRYPANVMFTHTPDCVEVGSRTVKAPVINRFVDGAKPFGGAAGAAYETVQTGDENGEEAIAVFDCAPGCPVAELDTQSGIRTSGAPGVYSDKKRHSGIYNDPHRQAGEPMTGFGDSGGASRFYPTFKYVPKATSEDRATVWVPVSTCVDTGHCPDPHEPSTRWDEAASPTPRSCDVCGTAWEPYLHPTVKPPAVMEWLIRLVTPPDGTVLDMFSGTGTTGVVATAEGFPSVLIERDPVHVAMTHKRMSEPIQTSLFGVA